MNVALRNLTPIFVTAGVIGTFSLSLPAVAQLSVNSDNFESGLSDGNFDNSSVANWTIIDTGNGGSFGTFNPDGGGTWYDLADFDDASLTGGEVGTMSGPVSAYLFGGTAGDGFSRDLGLIEGDQQYTATFSISGGRGSATNNDTFHGYTFELFSGTTILNSVSSNLSPGTYQDVSVAWQSVSLPGGVSVGDDLSVRILANGQGNYLDFDNFRVVGTSVPEPASSSLIALSLAAIFTRRTRQK